MIFSSPIHLQKCWLSRDHSMTFSPYVSSPRSIGDISPNSAKQCTTVGEHSMRHIKVKNVADTSAMFPTCSCKYRRCIFDVVISPMVWMIHRRCSPMFPNCFAKHWGCYGDVSLNVGNVINLITIFNLHTVISFGSHKVHVCGST